MLPSVEKAALEALALGNTLLNGGNNRKINMKNPWLNKKEAKEEEFTNLMNKVCIAGHDDAVFFINVDLAESNAKSEKEWAKLIFNKYKNDEAWIREVILDLNANKTGFPLDDAYSLGSGSANLDIFYNSQYVQGETLQVLDNYCGCTSYQAIHTPIVPGTVSGIVAFNELNGYSFSVDSLGVFNFKRLGVNDDPNNLNLYYDEVYSSSTLDLNTGVLKLDWHSTNSPKVTVNYEYNME